MWSFTTADFLVLDDFEDYNNFSPDTVWEAWADGFGNQSNGSQVGHDIGNTVDEGEYYVERNDVNDGVVYGGDQSMPFYYNNSGVACEATMALMGNKRDWTQHGIKALSLWYQGQAGSLGSFVEGPGGTYTITGAGSDIWGTADEFHFAWKNLNGVGSITARLDEVIANDTDPWVKTGLMIRESLDPGSKFAAVYITSGNGCRFQPRAETGGDASSDGAVTTLADVTVPHWIRLDRDFSGNFLAYDSNDGVTWFPLAWSP